MSKASKGQQLGPVPAPRDELRAGHARPAMSNPSAPAQGSPAGSVRSQLAQGRYTTASPVPDHQAGSVQHLATGAPPAVDAVTLRLTAAHPHSGMNTDAHGAVPSLRVQEVRASEAATELGRPGDFRSHPAGMAGAAQAGGPTRTADGSYGVPAFATPVRPAGPAAIAYDTAALAGLGGGGGQLQGHVPDSQPPGHEWSTPAPGSGGYSRFGMGHPA